MLFSNFKNNVIQLGMAAGSMAGHVYGGPLGANLSRAFAGSLIPKWSSNVTLIGTPKAMLWNINRMAAIEHIGSQGFALGTTYGPLAGGLIGLGAGMAVNMATEKALNTLMAYREYKNNLQGYGDLNNDNNNLEIDTIDENDAVIVNNSFTLDLR